MARQTQIIKFQEGGVVFRNTWKTSNGYIRTNLYKSEARARSSASSTRALGHLYQEIATPVHQEYCITVAPEYHHIGPLE